MAQLTSVISIRYVPDGQSGCIKLDHRFVSPQRVSVSFQNWYVCKHLILWKGSENIINLQVCSVPEAVKETSYGRS